MYLRRCYRSKDGKRHGYWALVESHRSSRGPRQRVVAYLGEMDAAGRLGIHQQAAGAATVAQRGLFRDVAPQWVEVDLQRIAVERKRALGGPWLGLELSRQVGLVDFLEQTLPTGREEIPWAVMAQILILARLCDPSSELQIAAHFYEASALSDLLGVPASKVNEDRLYRALDQLLPHKEALERIERLYRKAQRIWVMDSGLVSEENLRFLKAANRRYLVGTPKGLLKRFEGELRAQDWQPVREGLEVRFCPAPGGEEIFLLCRSAPRKQKEQAMHERFEKRIEEGLAKIAASCRKRKRRPAAVGQRRGG